MLGRDRPLTVCALGLGCMGMSEFSAPATRPSRSPRSSAPWSSASRSSTPPTCTAWAPTRSFSDARSRAGATTSSSRRSSASCARTAPVGSTPAARTPSARSRRRCDACGPTASTSTTCTAATPTCRSRRRSARSPSSSRRARSAASASARSAPRRCGPPARCTRSRRCRASGRCSRAGSRPRSCRPLASSASGSCPTARSAAGFSPGSTPRSRTSPRTIFAATSRAFRVTTSKPTCGSSSACARSPARSAARRHSSRSPGCCTRATTSCRSPAPSASGISRRTPPRRTSPHR